MNEVDDNSIRVKAMLRGVPNWIIGLGRAKDGPNPPAPTSDRSLEKLWIDAVEKRTTGRVDDMITGQNHPSVMKPAPKSGRGHWFDHR